MEALQVLRFSKRSPRILPRGEAVNPWEVMMKTAIGLLLLVFIETILDCFIPVIVLVALSVGLLAICFRFGSIFLHAIGAQ